MHDDLFLVAVERILAERRLDGSWRSPYLGGPAHAAMSVLATSRFADQGDRGAEAELGLLMALEAFEAKNGGLFAYRGAEEASGPVSRIAALGVRRFLVRRAEWMQTHPHARTTLEALAGRAEGFARQAPLGSLFYAGLAAILSGDLPFSSVGAGRWASVFLHAEVLRGVRDRLSSFVCEALPATALLVDKATSARGTLESDLRAQQGNDGGWIWSVMGTALSLLAFASKEPADAPAPSDDPVLANGLAFLRNLRQTDQTSWCDAGYWDTAVAISTLNHFANGPVGTPHALPNEIPRALEVAVEFLLAGRCGPGLWSFGAGCNEPDFDSSATAIAALARTAAYVHPALGARMREAVRVAAGELVRGQQSDGGWGYSPAPYRAPYGFGRRVPSAIETAIIDASTPDVSGRALGALLAARANDALMSVDRTAFDGTLTRARRYFAGAQVPSGSWVPRWCAGYLSSAAFIAPVLRAADVAPEDPLLAGPRAFAVAHVNPDGGWGETPEADRDPALAGIGPSSPVQTAYAIMTLVATSPSDTPEPVRTLEAAAAYLGRMAKEGRWTNTRALYTAAFQDDYYEAPLMTQCMVTNALLYLADAREYGVRAATQRLILGVAAQSA